MTLIYYNNQMITEPVNSINSFTISSDIFHTDYYFHENEFRTLRITMEKNKQTNNNNIKLIEFPFLSI